MGDTLLDEQRRILKLGQVLKNLSLSHSSKQLLTDEDATEFKELFLCTLEDVNKLSKFLLLQESQIDKENVFKTIQLFLEQQQIIGNIKEDLDEFTRYVALDSAFSQLMTLRLCLWQDPNIKRNYEIYSIAKSLDIEEREPVKVLESATKKVNELKPSLPAHSIEPIVTAPVPTAQHAKFDEINTQFKEEYARVKLRYIESFDRSFQNMMSGVSDKHEKYLRVKHDRARVKIESSFNLWDTYNARWDLVTDLSRCALRRRSNNRAKGKDNTADLAHNTNVSSVKTHVENIQIEHVVTKAQKKYAKLQQAKQKKKDQKKRRKLKELGLLDTEEEKKAEAGEDNEDEDNDNELEEEGDDENKEGDIDMEPQEPKKKNRNKSEKQERRLKKKSKKDKTTPATNNNSVIMTLKEEPTTAPAIKAEKKKQKFVVVVGDDGGVDLGEKN